MQNLDAIPEGGPAVKVMQGAGPWQPIQRGKHLYHKRLAPQRCGGSHVV